MATTSNNNHFLGINEASNFLDISKSTLYKLTHKKAIRFYKYGRFVKFRLEDLQAWKSSRLVEIPTNAQIQAQAAIYCVRGNR